MKTKKQNKLSLVKNEDRNQMIRDFICDLAVEHREFDYTVDIIHLQSIAYEKTELSFSELKNFIVEQNDEMRATELSDFVAQLVYDVSFQDDQEIVSEADRDIMQETLWDQMYSLKKHELKALAVKLAATYLA